MGATLIDKAVRSLTPCLGVPTWRTRDEGGWSLISWHLGTDDHERSVIVWGDRHRVEVTVDDMGENQQWTLRGRTFPEATIAEVTAAVGAWVDAGPRVMGVDE